MVDFSSDWQNNQSSGLQSSSPSKGSAEFDSDLMKTIFNQNQFLVSSQQIIDRLILQCWDGSKLNPEEKNQVNIDHSN